MPAIETLQSWMRKTGEELIEDAEAGGRNRWTLKNKQQLIDDANQQAKKFWITLVQAQTYRR